jgi:hypothetical protein
MNSIVVLFNQVSMSDSSDQSAANSDHPKRSFLKRVATPAAASYWLALYIGTHIPNPDMLIGAHVSD